MFVSPVFFQCQYVVMMMPIAKAAFFQNRVLHNRLSPQQLSSEKTIKIAEILYLNKRIPTLTSCDFREAEWGLVWPPGSLGVGRPTRSTPVQLV